MKPILLHTVTEVYFSPPLIAGVVILMPIIVALQPACWTVYARILAALLKTLIYLSSSSTNRAAKR